MHIFIFRYDYSGCEYDLTLNSWSVWKQVSPPQLTLTSLQTNSIK